VKGTTGSEGDAQRAHWPSKDFKDFEKKILVHTYRVGG
jgi:hypothetical protein